QATGDGILSTADDGSQVYIQDGVVGARNPDGSGLGHIGYHSETNRAFYHIQTSLGTNFAISARVGTSANTKRKTIMDIFPGSSETYIRTNDFRHIGETGDSSTPFARFYGDVRIQGDLDASTSTVSAKQYDFRYGSWIYDQSTNSDLMVVGGSKVRLYTNGASSSKEAFRLDRTHGYMYRTLSMEGNNITNQSDLRLKHDITDTELNSLETIKSWEFVDYYWNDLNKQGQQFGLIAQNTSKISIYDEERDLWSINSSKQIMMN